MYDITSRCVYFKNGMCRLPCMKTLLGTTTIKYSGHASDMYEYKCCANCVNVSADCGCYKMRLHMRNSNV